MIVLVGWFIGSYNRFIKYRNKIEETWSGIDVALKRRYNLIPNLIRAIEGYGEHEAKILQTKHNYLTGSNAKSERVEEEAKFPNHCADFWRWLKHIRILKPVQIFLTCRKAWMRSRKISKRPEINITVTSVD